MKMKIKKIDFIIIAVLAAVFITALFVYKIQAEKQYIEIANSAERAMYIAFEKIDDIFRETENIVLNNREIMISEFNAINKSEFVQIVKDVERIKLSASYVDEVVLYKKDGDMLITSTGTADKKSFLQYSYAIDDEMLVRFEEIADSYLVNSVVALDTGDENKPRDMFVVPKKSDLYGVNMLVFVNEKNLIDFCGVSKNNRMWDTVLLDRDLKTVMSSSDNPEFGKAEAARLGSETQHYSGGLFVPFRYTQWFNYGNMLYHIEISNYMSIIYIIGLAAVMTALGVFLLHYRRRCRTLGDEADVYDKKSAVYCALTMPRFAGENCEMLEKMLVVEQTKRLYLISVIFIDVQNANMIPAPEEICSLAKENTSDIVLVETGRKRYSGIISIGSEVKVDDILAGIIEKIADIGDVVIVRSECFNKLDEIYSVYNSLDYIANNHSLTKSNCVITEKDCTPDKSYLVHENIRPVLVRLMENGAIKDITEYITELIDTATENDITFENYLLFIKTLYANLMNITDETSMDAAELQQLKEIFWRSVEEYSDHLSVNSIKAAFLNMVVMLVSKRKMKKKDNTDERILKYINQNYKGDIYLDKVAQEFGFTSKNLSAYFKRHFNIGFNEYVTHLRIEEAKRLLAETDEGVLNIANSIGYVNNATFNLAFKKVTGMSPSAYRMKRNGL